MSSAPSVSDTQSLYHSCWRSPARIICSSLDPGMGRYGCGNTNLGKRFTSATSKMSRGRETMRPRVSGVFLFSVSGGPSLSITQYISLSSVPLDLDFEDSASLWVLSGVIENPIELHRYNNGTWQPAPSDDYTKRLSKTIGENWEQLEGTASPESRFSGLYKAVFDNMASYLMKKEARLQSEKRKVSSGSAGAAVKVQKT